MIYKKIGDKIPSLSSLLLAGMLSPFGGCKKCEQDNKTTPANDPNQKMVNDASVGENKGEKHEGVSLLPNGCLEAIKKAYKYLLKISDLEHLATPKPYVLDSDKLAKTDSAKLKSDTERLFKSFYGESLEAYPVILRENLKKLGHSKFLKFATGYLGTGTSHKFAYASAMNQIAQFWSDLHEVYQSLDQAINDSDSKVKIDELKGRVNSLKQSINKDFATDKKFYDANKGKMPTGDELARFLTGCDEKNAKDSKTPNILSVVNEGASLDQPIAHAVWVKINKEDTSRDANINNLSVRGSGISKNWFVMVPGNKNKTSKNTMPDINSFPITGLKSIFNGSNLTIATPESIEDDQLSGLRGCSSQKVTLLQFLFAIFKGEQKGVDFLKLESADEQDTAVQLTGDNDSFQQLHQQALKSNQDFAQFLGPHIESKLSDLFVIPDESLYSKILGELNNSDQEQKLGESQANKDGDQNTLAVGSVAGRLFNHIITNVFRHTEATDSTSFANIIHKIKGIKTDIATSTASFEHRVAFKVLDTFFCSGTALLGFSTEKLSASKLRTQAINLIRQELMQTVVIKDKENSIFNYTNVSITLQNLIKNTYEALSKRHKSNFVQYKDIELIDGSKGSMEGNYTGFKMEPVREAMHSDCDGLLSVIDGNMIGAMSQQGKHVNYDSFFPKMVNLSEQRDYPELDKFRFAYLNASKASVAPEAALAPKPTVEVQRPVPEKNPAEEPVE